MRWFFFDRSDTLKQAKLIRIVSRTQDDAIAWRFCRAGPSRGCVKSADHLGAFVGVRILGQDVDA
jgi:hypothetical protein